MIHTYYISGRKGQKIICWGPKMSGGGGGIQRVKRGPRHDWRERSSAGGNGNRVRGGKGVTGRGTRHGGMGPGWAGEVVPGRLYIARCHPGAINSALRSMREMKAR